MKREWVIVGAVLVPFAVLVGAGFYFSPEPPSIVQAAPVPLAPAVAPVLSGAPLDPHPDPLPKGEGIASFPPELQAPLSAILPEVQQCFRDQKLKAAREVKVRFTPTRDGGFEKVEVDDQNPYLAACLEDVFAEVAWHPDGRQTFAPAAHTFSFDPSSD